MNWTRAKFFYGGNVFASSVAAIVLETVFGISQRPFVGKTVARHLSNDRRGGNRCTERVAVNNGARKNFFAEVNPHCVSQNEFRLNVQILDGAFHALKCRPINVQAVNLRNAHFDAGITYRRRNNFVVEDLADFGGKFFGIVKPFQI